MTPHPWIPPTGGSPRVIIDGSAIPDGSGGAATYVRELVRNLPQTGVTPTVVARRGSSTTLWPGAGRVLDISPTRRPMRLIWEQAALFRALADLDVDVLHSPHYTMPRRRPGDVDPVARVVTIHDLTFFTRPLDHERSKRLLFRSAIAAAAEHADALIAVSESTADDLTRFARPSCPVHVIPHGVDHDRFRPVATDAEQSADDQIRSRLNLDGHYILHLGTIEPRKNVEGLLRAYELLRNQESSVPRLVLAGTAWRGEWQRLRPDAERLGVTRLGHVSADDLVAVLRGAQVVAYPSFAEGYGLPVVEALAVGVPVVTSTDSVMHRLAGDAVLTADPANPASIATALAAALRGDGPGLADRLGCAARYRWSDSAEAHARVYAQFSSARLPFS